MRIARALLTLSVLTALAACESSPPAITAPGEARFDNGSGFGSGHRAFSDSTSSTTAAPSPTVGTAVDTTSAERGGSGFGSGH